MASENLTEDALKALQSPGFYVEDDSEVGERASAPFEDIDQEAGLQFYEHNFLGDKVSFRGRCVAIPANAVKRISGILESLFGQCKLVAYRTFTPDPARIFQFRRGGEEAGCILVALLWPPGSEAVYYSNSLTHKLVAIDSDNGLLRVPKAAVNQAGCGDGVLISLKNGGM
jgi:hypothetical protein